MCPAFSSAAIAFVARASSRTASDCCHGCLVSADGVRAVNGVREIVGVAISGFVSGCSDLYLVIASAAMRDSYSDFSLAARVARAAGTLNFSIHSASTLTLRSLASCRMARQLRRLEGSLPN